MDVLSAKIPEALKAHSQWVVWKHITRDGKPTKVPFTPDESTAKSTDPETWSCFDVVLNAYLAGGWEGIGFVLSESDPFTGIDLDGCYDPTSKTMADWARKIIEQFDTYAELSPSGTGVKLLIEGKFPLSAGKNKKLDLPQVGGKVPGIEIYDSKRFFTITGQRGKGPNEPQPRQGELEDFTMTHFRSEMLIERAKRYCERMEPAIAGQGGDKQTYKTVCRIVKGFGLSEQDALLVLREYNARCQPVWSENELRRKIQCALRTTGVTGYLAETRPSDWDKVAVPEYDMTDVGVASRVCIEVLDGLEARERKYVLSGLQAMYR